ncbi:cupin domain-containing protein [Desmospora profundinema]|uniref:Mannose-6-phosphate isomerase-like protein (Cupin superfamily) n=1 Tax=Desmospora profundinema TaxID=1571184 RepID=A0ABU1IUB2_9BACL|nr:cupin domain-containing protein [Desmospora profundinema]MDR6227350.1 mannose-6-phosphate isomerase-like protein (cupin superfamily) [Desmospora profundinema]
MKIQRLDRENLGFEYNLYAQRTFPWKQVVTPPFEGAWCVLPPGQQSTPHSHEEKETFIIVKGTGQVVTDHEKDVVKTGDVIYFEPHTEHSIINIGGEDLEFFSVWWWDKQNQIQTAEDYSI